MTLLDTIAEVQAETEAIHHLPPAEATNSSFSSILPTLQLWWDSTSLSALKVCPRYYYYTIVQSLAPRGTNAHLVFGLEFHAALETYDRLRATGTDHESALLAALRDAFANTWNKKLNRPWSSDEPTKTRETLIRSIVWYIDQFGPNDHLSTVILANGKAAVELSFRIDIDYQAASTGEDFFLCGHLDKLASEPDGTEWIVDRKTTKSGLSESYFDRFSPDCQMSLYALAGNSIRQRAVKGIIIDACQVLVNGTRFQRGFVHRTASQLEEWLRDTGRWLRLAEQYATAQHWPMNDKACNMYSSYNSDLNEWRGGCPFKPVCGASPEVRPTLLRGLYDRRTWDPRQTREV